MTPLHIKIRGRKREGRPGVVLREGSGGAATLEMISTVLCTLHSILNSAKTKGNSRYLNNFHQQH
jgi:hypothetical protein